jgi:hypothetical protein
MILLSSCINFWFLIMHWLSLYDTFNLGKTLFYKNY